MQENGTILIDRLLPRSLGDSPEARFVGRLLAVMLLVATGSFLALCGLHLNAGNLRLALAQGVATLIALALLFAFHHGARQSLIAHLVVLIVSAQICLVTVLYGGVRYPAMAFFAVTPLVALLTLGRRPAQVWLLVNAALIVGLYSARAAGVPFPQPPPPNGWLDAGALLLLVLVVLLLTAAHVSLSERALAALRVSNEELARARAEAELANTAKDRLVATVSHELRTPLTGAIGFARLLNDAKLGTPHAEYALAALTSGETLLALVNDILDRARLSRGSLELQRAPFDLHRVLDEVVRVAAVSIGDKDVQIILDGAAPRWVQGDAVRLKQVLLNLVGNAVKFTPEGSVTLRVVQEGQGRLRFTVVDTGVGIPAEALGRLFQPFSRVDNSTTRSFGGSGLGLSIAKEIVERMGGAIRVDSAPGQGSTFWFDAELPVAEGPSVGVESAERRAPLPLRVLVVDDNAVNRNLAVRFLEQLGATGVAVPSAREGLSALQGGGFDAVLLDCEMPEMDGYELARRIRAAEPAGQHLPLVALTASALPEDRTRALAAGMDDLITKPFDPEVLGDRLTALVPRNA